MLAIKTRIKKVKAKLQKAQQNMIFEAYDLKKNEFREISEIKKKKLRKRPFSAVKGMNTGSLGGEKFSDINS